MRKGAAFWKGEKQVLAQSAMPEVLKGGKRFLLLKGWGKRGAIIIIQASWKGAKKGTYSIRELSQCAYMEEEGSETTHMGGGAQNLFRKQSGKKEQ